MLVFWQAKLVVLSVPKTGTTALEAALAGRAALVLRDPPGLKHMTLRRCRRFVLPLLEAGGGGPFETVAVLREPVSWLGSWWRYRARDEIAGHANSTRGRSFEDFVVAWCLPKPPPWAAVGSQVGYARAPDGARADRLFRYEDLSRFTAFLAARLGAPVALPQVNVSPPGEAALSPEALAGLRGRRPEEFAAWEEAGDQPSPSSAS